MEGSMSQATTLSAPEEQIDALMKQVADENGLEITAQLPAVDQHVAERSKGEEDHLTTRFVLFACSGAPQLWTKHVLDWLPYVRERRPSDFRKLTLCNHIHTVDTEFICDHLLGFKNIKLAAPDNAIMPLLLCKFFKIFLSYFFWTDCIYIN